MSALVTITPKIAELLRKMKQTANRSLRKSYADQAKALLRRAEIVSDKQNPEEQAGIRRLRNELIITLDAQFPVTQRQEDLKEISGENPIAQSCSLGIIEGDTIHQGLRWPVVILLAIVAFGAGRSTKLAYRRMMRRRRK